jgi:hypothetical protein
MPWSTRTPRSRSRCIQRASRIPAEPPTRIWSRFQDGDGAWRAITGTGGVYHATATGERYSVAVGCPGGLRFWYETVSDTAEVAADGCATEAGNVQLSITLQPLPTNEHGELWFGRAPVFGRADSSLQLGLSLPAGPVDVFASSYATTTGDRVIHKLYRGPTLNLQADQVVQYDIAALGLPPEGHPLSVTGIQAEDVFFVHSSYATPNSQIQWPLFTQHAFTGPPSSYVTIDASLRQASDISNVTVVASVAVGELMFDRTARLAVANPAALTVALPSRYTAPAPTIASGTVPRATVTIPISPATLTATDYSVALSTSNANFETRSLSLFATSAWAAGQSSVAIATPDLSGLAGWTADMELESGLDIAWSITRNDRNMAPNAIPADGRRILHSSTSGTIASHIAVASSAVRTSPPRSPHRPVAPARPIQ